MRHGSIRSRRTTGARSWLGRTYPGNAELTLSGERSREAISTRAMEFLFVPPDQFAIWPLGKGGAPPDPVTELRDAISAGRAHLEGRTQLDGRTVERIRIDHPPAMPHMSAGG